MATYEDLPERITNRIELDPEGCWLWTGYKFQGYGRATALGSHRQTYVHRIMYEHFRGPIPEGHSIDHLCQVKRCCNPDHLEAVTVSENARRGGKRSGERRQQSE